MKPGSLSTPRCATMILLAATCLLAGCGNKAPIVQPSTIPGRDLNAAGLRLFHAGDLERAEETFLHALAASEAIDDQEGKAETLYNLAIVHREQGQIAAANEELVIVEKRFRKLERPGGVARAMAARGSILAEQDRLKEACVQFEKALSEAPASVAPEILSNLAIAHRRLGQLDRAQKEAERAASRAKNDMVRSDALFTLATIHVEREDLESAERLFLEVLELDRRLDRRRQLAATLTQLARLAALEGRTDDATDYYTRAAGVYEALDLEEPSQRMRKRAEEAAQ